MATLPDWPDFAWWRSSIGEDDISGKGLVEKEAMERTHSEDGADLDDPDWEVDPKVKLEVDIKESDDIKDDVSQQKHT